MRLPAPELAANIERRLLVNYRLDAGVAQSLLPDSLRPQLVDGSAVAGICLLRLAAVRPTWLAPQIGWGAENAAHRIAVEWDDDSGIRSGVYIPRRHSASWLPVVVGGRVFPGVYEHARFEGSETDDRVQVMMSADGMFVRADVTATSTWASSLFGTVEEASAFFQHGAIGWSPSRDGRTLQGLALQTAHWSVQPAQVRSITSSFFDALPTGSATLDSVLMMRNVPVTWRIPMTGAPSVRRKTRP